MKIWLICLANFYKLELRQVVKVILVCQMMRTSLKKELFWLKVHFRLSTHYINNV